MKSRFILQLVCSYFAIYIVPVTVVIWYDSVIRVRAKYIDLNTEKTAIEWSKVELANIFIASVYISSSQDTLAFYVTQVE